MAYYGLWDWCTYAVCAIDWFWLRFNVETLFWNYTLLSTWLSRSWCLFLFSRHDLTFLFVIFTINISITNISRNRSPWSSLTPSPSLWLLWFRCIFRIYWRNTLTYLFWRYYILFILWSDFKHFIDLQFLIWFYLNFLYCLGSFLLLFGLILDCFFKLFKFSLFLF